MGYRNYIKWIILLIACLMLWGCSANDAASADGQITGDFGYILTKEQAENYESAVCYLIKREGENYYRVQYDNCGVTYADGKLQTKFDGMGILLSSPWEGDCFPVVDLQGNEDTGRCLCTLWLRNQQGSFEPWRFLLQPDDQNAEQLVFIAGYNEREGTDEELLAGKYQELPDFSAYTEMIIYYGTIYQIVRDESGKPLPVENWQQTDWFLADGCYNLEDVVMHDTPLVGGEYYLLYEITDKQGNTYCSDLIPYPTVPMQQETKEPDITVKWEKGQRQQLLFESDGLEIYLSVVKDSSNNTEYALKVKNDTEKAVSCSINDVYLNGNISTSAYNSVTVQPGKFTEGDYGLNLGAADGSAELEKIETMQLEVHIKDSGTGKQICAPKTVLIDMTDAWPITRQYAAYFDLKKPAMDALATEQVLLETDVVRVILVAAGKLDIKYADDLQLTYRVENLSQRSQSVNIEGAVVNDAFVSHTCRTTIPGGCIIYATEKIRADDVKKIGGSIETLSVLIEIEGQEDWTMASTQQHWTPVTLSKSGKAMPFNTGEVLWEQGGIKVNVVEYNANVGCWEMVLINDTQQDISLAMIDTKTGSKLGSMRRAGAGQKCFFRVNTPSDGRTQLPIHLQIFDFAGQNLLAEATQAVILKTQN